MGWGPEGGVGWGKERVLGGRGMVGPEWGIRGPRVGQGGSGQGKWLQGRA